MIRVNVPTKVTEVYANPDGLYVISVAARLLEMHPQTLRKYERVGLVSPSRTVGMLRLYSEEDIGLDQAEPSDLKKYLEDCLEDMFEILKGN